MSTQWFQVKIPSENGFVGRECVNKECGRYFKIQATDAPEKLHCPYCGESGTINQTHTREQLSHAKNVATEKMMKYANDEISRMLSGAFGGLSSRSGPVRIEFKPAAPYQEKKVYPRYREKRVDTDLTCPSCGFLFKVYGIFGFCPRCRTENAQILDTNLAIIRQDLAAAKDKRSGLRHAYNDLVSAVELFCKNKAPQTPGEKRRNYQRLDEVGVLALTRTGKSLDQILGTDELTALRMFFQKRHVSVHNGGIVDEKFAKEVPGSDQLVGTPVELSADEFEAAAKAVHRLIGVMFIPAPSPHFR